MVPVIEDELLVLARRGYLLAQLFSAERTIHEGHGHGLALCLAEGETVAARELGRRGERALELIHHLALGHRDVGDLDGEAELLGDQLHRDLAHPDLAREGMIAAVSPLGGVAQSEEEALVAAREALQ